MNPSSSQFDISSARFAFLDLETTGLSPWFGDRICEMGIVLTEGRRIKQQVQMLVNPERPLSLGAASTSGLTDEQLAQVAIICGSGGRYCGVAERDGGGLSQRPVRRAVPRQ